MTWQCPGHRSAAVQAACAVQALRAAVRAAWKRHVTPLLRTLPHPVLCNGAEKDRCRMEPGAARCSGSP